MGVPLMFRTLGRLEASFSTKLGESPELKIIV